MACCNGEKNESIKCTVTQCANHCDSADYCSLQVFKWVRTRLILQWLNVQTVTHLN